MKKLPAITLSDVAKKDIKLIGFLVLNGLTAYVSMMIEADPTLSLIFGGVVNYIAYRCMQEIEGSGYFRALKK